MSFSSQDVVKLRQNTGAGMMDCKNALTEANGDVEKASEILRQRGLAQAAKKAEKTTFEGIVTSKISADNKSAVILELNSQTDFVAKNDVFIALSKDLLDLILSKKPASVDALLDLDINGTKVSDKIASAVSQTGENIQVRRFQIFNLSSDGVLGTYIHPVGNKIGVLTLLSGKSSQSLQDLARDISMHIAASQPQPEFIDKSQIPQEIIENEKRIELGKEDVSKKPKEIAEKIVQGRLDKVLSQRCLINQPFIKDPNITIEKLIQEKSKELGADIKIVNFIRYNVGESTDKSSDEEAKEAASIK